MVNGHTDRLLIPARDKIEERFWAKVNKDGPIPEHRPELGPCWVWQGTLGKNGYAYLSIGSRIDNSKRMEYGHRLIYEWIYGPIPLSLQIDHLCQNRACVNFKHLELVTSQENTRRGNARLNGREQSAKTHCPQGHPYDASNTLIRPNGWRHCKACRRAADRYRYQIAKGGMHDYQS